MVGAFLLGCNKAPAPVHRVELRKLGDDRVELVPLAGAPPRCLAFTIAEKGLVRQLTMSPEKKSLDCPPGRPIGGTSFRIPPTEGKVRIYVFFSDLQLSADSVAHQVSDLSANPSFSVLDLRLPGHVVADVLEYP